VGIRLGANRYGKAESRVVRIVRDTARHEIHDLNVSTSLRGDFEAAHVEGDQSAVLPTDTQKNTAFAYAKEHGVASIEDYALALGLRLLEATPAATGAHVAVEEYTWDRIFVGGDTWEGHDHAFVRRGGEVRTAEVDVTADAMTVRSGLTDLVVLKSTGSEFKGFLKDAYTTLPEADDRVLATSLTASWRWALERHDQIHDVDWNAAYGEIRSTLLEEFATTYSRALQETLWVMGRAVLERRPGIAEISFAAPNKHHFLVDLSPFGVANDGEVFIASDRPYGLIEATITRDDG
jgi:urate oxidase